MLKRSYIFLLMIFAAAMEASAQFSIAPMDDDIGVVTRPFVVQTANQPTANVINAAKARFLRRKNWRLHNAIDTRVSFTGTLTQYNQSWIKDNQNAVALELTAYYYHTYTLGIHTSLFKFDAAFGMNYMDKMWFKNQDAMKFYYLASWKFRKKGGVPSDWAYSLSTDFISQFAEGRVSRTDKTVLSNFMAPATLNLGTGVTWTSPYKKVPFIVTVNPISGNFRFVMDRRIDDVHRGTLGINLPAGVVPVAGEHKYADLNKKIEGGSSVNVSFNRTFDLGFGAETDAGKRARRLMGPRGMTLQYNTTLASFYGWITQVSKKRDTDNEGAKAIVPTVNWVNSLIFNPLRFLTVEFRHTMLYDRSQVDKVQMQYYLRLGITFRYRNR